MEVKVEKNEDLGYNTFFELKRIELGFSDFSVARVIAQYKGAYKVKNIDGEFLAKITGKQIFNAKEKEDYPAVGDWVSVTKADEENMVINGILPRQTIIKRRFGDKNRVGEKRGAQVIATNIDVGFIIESVDRDYNLNRFERYLSILSEGQVKGAIILNKTDLLTEREKENKLNELENRFPNIDIILTNTLNDSGFRDLINYIIKGKTYCFLGSSGVGKSSLINKLLGREIIETGDVSSYSDRGKHTTTGRQMYFLDNGGIVIDNPGIREVGLADATMGVDNFFDEISIIGENCKYVNCTHVSEPGCAVLEAIEKGEIDKEKYINYTGLKKESEYYDMNFKEKKEKDKNFGKLIKKAKKDLKNFGNANYQ